MGRTYLYVCCRCCYRASVSGRAETGEQFAVQTIACEDCRELFDAVVRLKSRMKLPAEPEAAPAGPVPAKPAPKFSEMLNRLPPRGARQWLAWKPACPNDPKHRVRPWHYPDRCPKCGSPMEPNDRAFRLWD